MPPGSTALLVIYPFLIRSFLSPCLLPHADTEYYEEGDGLGGLPMQSMTSLMCGTSWSSEGGGVGAGVGSSMDYIDSGGGFAWRETTIGEPAGAGVGLRGGANTVGGAGGVGPGALRPSGASTLAIAIEYAGDRSQQSGSESDSDSASGDGGVGGGGGTRARYGCLLLVPRVNAIFGGKGGRGW